MQYIYGISPNDLSRHHVSWLAEGSKLGYIKMDAVHYVKEVLAGRAKFWDIRNGPEGILVTTLNEWPDGRELMILLIAGAGLIRARLGIHRDLRRIAKMADCNRIGWETTTPERLKYFMKLGFAPVAARFMMETEDGWQHQIQS